MELKKVICLVISILFASFIFCGCQPSKFEGEICELEYKEEYTTMVPITTIIYNGKTSIPITTYYIRTYPDRWYVKVKIYNSGSQEYEYYDCYVTEECFNKLNIGDWFVYDEEYCFDEEPYTQKRKGE